MNNIQIKILRNLKERVHGVGKHIALSGVEEDHAGTKALNHLVRLGKVIEDGNLYTIQFHTRMEFMLTAVK